MRPAILPDWWDETCANDPSLLLDIEIRVARFLGLPLAAIRDPDTSLDPPPYPQAQLRRRRDVSRERLVPAIHSAMQIAGAVVRSLRTPAPEHVIPPTDGLKWREQIVRERAIVTLDDILSDLWLHGIPVVPLDILPAPRFQGVACIVEGRPVILLGYKHDEPGRIAFRVAHEAGHIAAGDCMPDRPVIDEEEGVRDDSDMECKADRYATRTLIGKDEVPPVVGGNFKDLANDAARLEHTSGADASVILFAWAARTGDYANASMAVKALYRATGAKQQLRQHFDRHVDLEAANESDRALLRCVHGEPERDASVG